MKILIVAASLSATLVAFVAVWLRRAKEIREEHPWVPPWVYINDLEVAQGKEMFIVVDGYHRLKELMPRVH